MNPCRLTNPVESDEPSLLSISLGLYQKISPLLTLDFYVLVLASLLQLLTPWILRYGIDFYQ
jgi:hypothetical protein